MRRQCFEAPHAFGIDRSAAGDGLPRPRLQLALRMRSQERSDDASQLLKRPIGSQCRSQCGSVVTDFVQRFLARRVQHRDQELLEFVS